MPTIGKFVIGNVGTLQSASNIYVDPSSFKYVHASSSNIALALKNIDDTLEESLGLLSGSNTWTGANTFSGKLTASNGLSVTGDVSFDDASFSGTTSLAALSISGDLTASQGLIIPDDTLLRFGSATGGDVTIEYDENGTDELRFAGNAVTFEQAVTFDGNVTLGNAASDVTTVTGKLTASNGLSVTGNVSFDDASFSGTTSLAGLSISGALTASNGLSLSGGELILDKNRLSADGNAGATGDSVVVFDASDSDLAKRITVSQLSSLVGVGAATAGNNTWTGTNTFSGKLTASNGLDISNHLAADDGVVTISGKLTASNGGYFASAVGIGTASPDSVLHVQTPASHCSITLERDAKDTGEVGLNLNGGTGGKFWYLVQQYNSDNLTFHDTDAARVTFEHGGNVGIGTTTPSTTLQVVGTTTLSGDVTASQGLTIPDDTLLRFGSAAGGDVTVEYDEDGTDELRFAGNAVTFEQAVTFDGNVTLGNDANDVVTIPAEITASAGMLIPDDKGLYFGTDKDATIQYNSTYGFVFIEGSNIRIADDKTLAFGTGGDATIEYDENGTDELRFAGAAAKFEQKVTVEGDLTASNGFSLSGGELILDKNRLGADGNAGASGDSIMLFDASDSDLAKRITISQLDSLVGGSGGGDSDAGDYYGALTGSNTWTAAGSNTFAGKLTASNGIVVSNYFTADDGTTTISSKLTASNGINISGGELVMNKSRLTADTNAGQGADALMIFDSSDSDLAKTITITQLSSLVGAGGDAGDYYGALTGSNTWTAAGSNTFAGVVTVSGELTASAGISIPDDKKIYFGTGFDASIEYDEDGDNLLTFAGASTFSDALTVSHLTASKGIQVASMEAIKANADGGGYLSFEAAGATFSGAAIVMGSLQCGSSIFGASITASNGLYVMGSDDDEASVVLVADTGSFTVGTEGSINLTTSNEAATQFPISLGNGTAITGDLTVTGAITGSNGFSFAVTDEAGSPQVGLSMGADGAVLMGVPGVPCGLQGAVTSYGPLTASNGIKIITSEPDVTPTFEIYNQGAGDAAMMWSVSGDSFAMGIDNNDSDIFKLSYSGTAQDAELGTNDLFEIDSNGNIKIGSNSSASPTGSSTDNSIFISSTHKAFLHLEGDSDNSGEEGTAYIKFEQDGGAVEAIIGTIGGGNTLDPEGNAYTGTFDNNFLIGTQQNFGMQLGTNSTTRINIENDGEIKFISTAADTTANSANLVINSSTGLLERSTSDRRQKHTITSITSSLADVCQLEPKYFYDIEDVSGSVKLLGLVADETEAVFPELVPERDLPSDVYRSVAYDRVVVYLINALKEVKQRLEDLEGGD